MEHGRGRLKGPGKVEVEGKDGSRTLIARKGIILANGSRPREIGAYPTDGVRIMNSDHLLEIPDIPKRLAVLGAGAVGVEFASVFSRFGSKVTLIEMLPRIVPLEDEEVSDELARAFKKQKIDVRVATTMKSAKVEGDVVQLALEKDGAQESIEVDVLLVAVGRAPNSEDAGLE